jgi:bacteriorhodopsin
MLAQTGFSLAQASVQQEIAFVGFAIFTIGFFIWLAFLARRK